jgi:hypothetical protein
MATSTPQRKAAKRPVRVTVDSSASFAYNLFIQPKMQSMCQPYRVDS